MESRMNEAIRETKKAEECLEYKRTLCGMMSHEICTPLSDYVGSAASISSYSIDSMQTPR